MGTMTTLSSNSNEEQPILADRSVLLTLGEPTQAGWRYLVKRLIDISVALLLLVLLAPLLLVLFVWVRLDSPGPAIFKQVRVGLRGRQFTVLKFRSMCLDADSSAHREFLASQMTEGARLTHYKVQQDDRVTRCGRFIRQLSLDELPQLFNVLRGQMSLVGPRPDVPYSLEQYEPRHYRRFDAVPGLTGLWQVSGRSTLSFREMLDLDIEYVERWSLLLDVKLLARTVPELLRLGRAG
jgi:lipopolysaccharide/colanic/teichoic acid biosynthesis glycosyltransferase